MPRPEEKVRLPLPFREALSDLLKVKPEAPAKRADLKKARPGGAAKAKPRRP